MPLTIENIAIDLSPSTKAFSSPYIVYEAAGVRAQSKALSRAGKLAQWDEIIVLPGHFPEGTELVAAAYNHNAILADDLIGSGGIDLKNLRARAHRRLELFNKDDERVGELRFDVSSVEKEGMAGAAAAPAVAAAPPVEPVGGGGGGGGGAAAAPTTPGAEGEVRRTPSGPSAVEAERERRQQQQQQAMPTSATSATTAAAAPEGEGAMEKVKRAIGLGGREPSPERAPLAAAAPAPSTTRTIPAPAPRGEKMGGREGVGAGEGGAGAIPTPEAGARLSPYGRPIEGPEGGEIVERRLLTRQGTRLTELERTQLVTVETPVDRRFVVETRLLNSREGESRRREGPIRERVVRVEEPESPAAVAPGLEFKGETKEMRRQAVEGGGGGGGGAGMTSSSSSTATTAGGGMTGGGGGGGGEGLGQRMAESLGLSSQTRGEGGGGGGGRMMGGGGGVGGGGGGGMTGTKGTAATTTSAAREEQRRMMGSEA